MFERFKSASRAFFAGALAITIFVGFFVIKAAVFGMAAAGGWHLYNHFFGKSESAYVPSPEDFEKVQDQLNKSLPKRIDEWTVLDHIKVDVKTKDITYYEVIKNKDGEYLSEEGIKVIPSTYEALGKGLKHNFCTSSDTQPLRSLGFVAHYVFSTGNTQLTTINVNNSDCSS